MSHASAKVQPDPSMEEILASIRRIISDENPAAGTAPSTAFAEAARRQAMLEQGMLEAEAEAAANPVPAEPMSQDAVDALLAGGGEQPHPPEVLELTEAVDVSAPQGGADTDIVFREEGVDEEFETSPPPAAAPARSAPPPRAPEPAAKEDALLSTQTKAAVTAAFDALAHTIIAHNPRTVEELVQEMLRPMLKHWLDDNLPVLVERLVRAEIERVSRGR